MSISTTINLIQTVNANILNSSGTKLVRYAPAFGEYPLSADSVRLPMALTWPEAGQWDREHFGSKKRTDRTYTIMVFVEALGQNTLPGRSQLAVTLLDAFINTWMALDANGYPTALANPTATQNQVTVEWGERKPSDSGVITSLAVGATMYSGFTISIPIRELW